MTSRAVAPRASQARGETLELRVSPAVADRLDRFLAGRLPELTRSALRRLILAGQVTIDGAPARKPGLPVQAGMRIAVRLPAAPPDRLGAESIPLRVVFEDDLLLVVDKPAGLVVHPGHGQRSGTLVNALLGRGTPLASAGAPDRPGIVHRLDQLTSGLLVVAKTDAAYHGLCAQFAGRTVHKRYLALVWGHPRPERGTIERPIGRSRSDPLKMAVAGTRGARPAVTSYVTLESLPGFALLSVEPATGRTHQIRVHLQAIHHPVVGDARYGGRPWRGVREPGRRRAVREFPRLALHAAELGFAHPASGRPVRFEAPLPGEFAELLRLLREP